MELLPVFAALLAVSGAVPYIIAVLRGSVRPKIVSWVVWMVLAGVLTVSAYQEGQMGSAMLSFATFVGCCTITTLAWKRGSRTVTRSDVVCLLGAVAGLVVLFVLQNPLAAIITAVVVDAIAYVPTLLHAWTDPHEESMVCFMMAAVGGGLTLASSLSAGSVLAGMIYPLYAIVFNTIMVGILIVGRGGFVVRESYERGNA